MSILREVLQKLSGIVSSKCSKQMFQNDSYKCELVRQSTRPEYGDICIPRGVVAMEFPTTQHVTEVTDAILASSETLPLPILACSPCVNGFVSIRLCRPLAFKRIIGEVLKQGQKYGHRAAKTGKMTVVLNVPQRAKAGAETPLAILRQHLMAQHVLALLDANGYYVHEGSKADRIPESSALRKILGESYPPESSDSQNTSSKDRGPHHDIAKELSSSKFVSVGCQTNREIDGTCDDTVPGKRTCEGSDRLSRGDDQKLPQHCRLDLNAVLKDQGLRRGKGRYSQNLSDVILTNEEGEPMPVLRQYLNLQQAVEETSADETSILHIVPSSQEFVQQQVDLTLRALSPLGCYSPLHQSHLSCAPIMLMGKTSDIGETGNGTKSRRCGKSTTTEEFYAVRESQMREASVMKYGDQVRGESWDRMIQSLTAAGIKFDILGTHFRHQVKLDVGEKQDSSPWPDNRNGVFVVYNYARLATLFSRFEEEVQRGTYPPLPPIDDIDFSTLKVEAEWKLLFSHILAFPDIVTDTVGDGFTMQELGCKFETHKVCRFLIYISQDLSTYYSRFRILVEPRPHLLPTIYARLYLLKAVRQVLGNGLDLLRIQPLTQM